MKRSAAHAVPERIKGDIPARDTGLRRVAFCPPGQGDSKVFRETPGEPAGNA